MVNRNGHSKLMFSQVGCKTLPNLACSSVTDSENHHNITKVATCKIKETHACMKSPLVHPCVGGDNSFIELICIVAFMVGGED